MTTKKSTLNLVTNSINLENAFASSIFLPETTSNQYSNVPGYEIDNHLIIRNEMLPINIVNMRKQKDEANYPVIVELKKTEFNKFYPAKFQNLTFYDNDQSCFLVQFLPVYIINKIYFETDDQINNFLSTKYNNLNKDIFPIVKNKNLFSSNKSAKTITIKKITEPTIAPSKILTFDSILGGLQSAIYLSKSSHLGNPERFFDVIKGLLASNNNQTAIEWFGFDIHNTLQNGLKSISPEDNLHIKIFKAALIKLSSQAYKEEVLGISFVESIFESLPRILFTEEEEGKINNFLTLCRDLSSGKEIIPKDFYHDDNWVIARSLVLLLTQSGKNEIDDIIKQAQEQGISDKILFTSILLFGFYRNYSSLSLAFKEKKDFQKYISLLSKIFLLNKGKISSVKDIAPNGLTSWWDLKIDSKIFARVSIGDVFLGSISGQALEAGYNFKFIDENTLILRKISKEGTDLTLKKIEGDFFSLNTEKIYDINNPKYSKLNLIYILNLMNNETVRSSVVANDEEIFLKQTQLSSTLDIEEMKSMIEGLNSDWHFIKSAIK